MNKAVRIVSGGLSRNTKVMTEDGQEICGVNEIRWSLKAGHESRASMEIIMSQVSLLEVPKFVVSHPVTGEWLEIAGYVLPDGSTVKIIEDKPQ